MSTNQLTFAKMNSSQPKFNVKFSKPPLTDQNSSGELIKSKEKNATREGKLKTSDVEALFHVIKGSMGSGLLAMPYAFSNGGLLMGFVGTIFVAVLAVHCTYILVKCSQELCFRVGKKAMTYSETVDSAFSIGAGGRLRKWSSTVRNVSDFFLFCTYYGINIVYVISIATTFKEVLEDYLSESFNIRWYILVLSVPLLCVGIVRHMKLLVPFSVMANILLMVGCVLTLNYCFIDLPPPSTRPLVVSYTKWPIFLCTTLFSIEGIGAVLPIENEMRNPSSFLGCFGVLNIAMFIVTAMYLIIGSVGYIRFGDTLEGNITLNLPNGLLTDTVKISAAIAILFTYPLQLSASTDVVSRRIGFLLSSKSPNTAIYITRVILILGTVAVSAGVPDLSPAISLVGAIGFSGLGLLLPALTEMATFWDTLSVATIVKNILIVIIWALASFFGTITSIQPVIAQYQISMNRLSSE